MKRFQLSETGRLRYAPDPTLPPLSFRDQQRDRVRARAAKRRAASRQNEKQKELDAAKAVLASKIKSERLRDAIVNPGKKASAETAPGARATRAVGAICANFPGVVALPGAKFGRLDLSSTRRILRSETAAKPKNALKAAARTSLLMGRPKGASLFS